MERIKDLLEIGAILKNGPATAASIYAQLGPQSGRIIGMAVQAGLAVKVDNRFCLRETAQAEKLAADCPQIGPVLINKDAQRRRALAAIVASIHAKQVKSGKIGVGNYDD